MSFLSELFTETTVDAIKGTVYGYLIAAGLPVRSWQPLSPTRVVVDAFARLQAATQNIVVQLAKSAFRSTATGQWLQTLSKELYDVDFIQQTYASGEFVANNTGAFSYDYDPGDLQFIKIGTTITYHNSAAVHFSPNTSGISVQIVADAPGSVGSAAPGQLALATTVLGVAGTNQLPLQGLDDESDDALRERDILSLGALSPNGPADAYEYVARTPAFHGVTVTKVRVLPPPGDGTISIIIANDLGPISTGDVALVQAAILENATPATVLPTTYAATEHPITVTADVWIALANSPQSDDLRAAIKTTLIDYVASLPIGGIELMPGAGVVPWSGIVAAIKTTTLGTLSPVLAVNLSAEINIPLLGTEVATLVESAITINVNVVRP